jgi:mRNA interferase RelE/StbE
MKYTISIKRSAQKSLADLPNKTYEKVKSAILELSDNPRPHGSSKLTNRDGWRIRIGDYRVIYEINDKEVTILVLAIGHRGDIYDR